MQRPTITTNREIGQAVKKRRVELGMSQERLAEILDVSYQQVQRYENGTRRLSIENLQLVAYALSVPVTYFFQKESLQVVAGKSSAFLSKEERNLLRDFRKMEQDFDKKLAASVMRRLAAKK